MNKEDRRFKKTEKALAEALSKLMMDKKIQSITIRELTETADLHRSTFYKHYTDIYDLYEQLEMRFFQDINQLISFDSTHSYEDLYINLVEYVYHHSFVYKLFITYSNGLEVQEKMKQLIEKNYLEIWLYEDKKNMITEEMKYFTTYHIQGCLSVLNYWVETNFAYSKKEMLELLQKLNNHLERIMP